jgi:hypothetical protein
MHRPYYQNFVGFSAFEILWHFLISLLFGADSILKSKIKTTQHLIEIKYAEIEKSQKNNFIIAFLHLLKHLQ